MKKTNFVLRALNLYGLEEILKLSKAMNVKQVPLKKAAGEELIVWDDAPGLDTPRASAAPEAKVLPFAKSKSPFISQEEIEEAKALEAKKKEESSTFLTSELVLWQREISRDSEESIQKLDAFKGYQRSTEMYVVKTQTLEGKEKIRFASTNGILVNKKQA